MTPIWTLSEFPVVDKWAFFKQQSLYIAIVTIVTVTSFFSKYNTAYNRPTRRGEALGRLPGEGPWLHYAGAMKGACRKAPLLFTTYKLITSIIFSVSYIYHYFICQNRNQWCCPLSHVAQEAVGWVPAPVPPGAVCCQCNIPPVTRSGWHMSNSVDEADLGVCHRL